MSNSQLSFSSRKALCVQLGEAAGTEIADLVQHLIRRVNELERNKVDVTPVVRSAARSIGQTQHRAA